MTYNTPAFNAPYTNPDYTEPEVAATVSELTADPSAPPIPPRNSEQILAVTKSLLVDKPIQRPPKPAPRPLVMQLGQESQL